MEPYTANKRILRFGPFEIDQRSAELRKFGVRIKVREQPFRILEVLVRRPGDLVTREELRQLLWPEGTFVDYDHGLNNALNRLREVLCDKAEVPRFIETVPRRGYRFIAAVNEVQISTAIEVPPAPTIQPPPKSAPTATHPRPVLLWTCAVCAAVVLIIIGWLGRTAALKPPPVTAPTSPAKEFSIAVLPIENFSRDSMEQYFADAVTDELITDLDRIGLRVKPRAAVMPFKGKRMSASQAGEQLGVAGIVEGSVIRDGQTVRLSIQFTEIRTHQVLWSGNLESNKRGVLRLQRSAATRIAAAIRDRMGSQEPIPALSAEEVEPEAYDALLRGRAALERRTREGFQEAQRYFEAAIAKDPNYAEAYAGLAHSYNLAGLGQGDLSAKEASRYAKAAALKAIELDSSSAEAHSALAFTKHRYERDWAGAEKEFQRALQLNPGCPSALLWYSQFLFTQHRYTDLNSLRSRLKIALPPSLFWSTRQVTGEYEAAGQPDKAVKSYLQALQVDPSNTRLHVDLAELYLRLGKAQQAIRELNRAERLSPKNRFIMGELGYAYAMAGEVSAAERMVVKLQENRQEGYPAYAIAKIQLGLHRNEEAIRWLQQAYAEDAPEMSVIDTRLTSALQTDPRYRELLRKLALPQDDKN